MNKIYLPSLGKSAIRKNVVGINSHMPTFTTAKKLHSFGTTFCTIGNFLWSKIEPEPGQYDLYLLDDYKNIVNNCFKNMLIPFPTVHSTPYWALLPDSIGATDKYEQFAKTMEMLINKFPIIINWQIFNEVDSKDGFAEHYGGWGDSYLQHYLMLLRSIQHLRNNNVKLSIGLMMPENSNWYINFSKQGGEDLIDNVNFHFYWSWWKGFNIDDLNYAFDYGLKPKIKELKKYFNKPLWLTETNLLLNDKSNPQYENMKSKWIENVIPISLTNGVDRVIIYSYQSGWRNANVKDLPAEESFKNMCKQYNI